MAKLVVFIPLPGSLSFRFMILNNCSIVEFAVVFSVFVIKSKKVNQSHYTP
jgi:hypothetical protein